MRLISTKTDAVWCMGIDIKDNINYAKVINFYFAFREQVFRREIRTVLRLNICVVRTTIVGI